MEFCTHYSNQFKNLFSKAEVQYDRFIRTTDSDHERAVTHYWNLLRARGHLKEGKHEGYYSVNEESFIAEKDLVRDESGGYKTEAGERVEMIQERNYVFEITAETKEAIMGWLKSNECPVTPEGVKN